MMKLIEPNGRMPDGESRNLMTQVLAKLVELYELEERPGVGSDALQRVLHTAMREAEPYPEFKELFCAKYIFGALHEAERILGRVYNVSKDVYLAVSPKVTSVIMDIAREDNGHWHDSTRVIVTFVDSTRYETSGASQINNIRCLTREAMRRGLLPRPDEMEKPIHTIHRCIMEIRRSTTEMEKAYNQCVAIMNRDEQRSK